MNTAAVQRPLSILVVVAGVWLLFQGLPARSGTITGTLTDDWDGLIPYGIGCGFTLEDLAWDGDGGNEDPDGDDGDDTLWDIQWKIDDGAWGPPCDREYFYDPTTHLLEPAGDHVVYARVRHEAGMDEQTGMVVWSDWKVFEDPVKIVGVGVLEYYDGDGWCGCPLSGNTLTVGKLRTTLFRAVPEGADFFPAGYPVWTGVPPNAHAEDVQVSRRYDVRSADLSDTHRITVSCGGSSQSVDIVVVEVVRLDWKYQGESDDAFVPVSENLDLERGRTVVFWARELAPAGAGSPLGGLGWVNAVPDPNIPDRATYVVPAPTKAPPDDYTQVEVAP